MLQVCELSSLQRLVLSTEQGSWGGEHARRRASDLQAPSFQLANTHQQSLLWGMTYATSADTPRGWVLESFACCCGALCLH